MTRVKSLSNLVLNSSQARVRHAMTDHEVLAAISLIGRDRATAQLARLRRSDLEAIAHERGVRVDVSRAEPAADLARRVVSAVTSRAERGAAQSRRRRSRQ